MHKWTDEEIRVHVIGVFVLIVAMLACAMLGEVSRQNWNSKVTAYPTQTEEAIENYARQLLQKMTLEQKVGQMFYAADGVDPVTAAQYGLGGVLLQTEQLENLSKTEIQAVLKGYKAEAEVPILVGVNEEGGQVNTLSVLPQVRGKAFLSARELLTTGGLKLVDADTREKADLLRELGVDLNLAPVCDVVEGKTAMMYDRSGGGEGDDAGRYVQTVLEAMTERRIIGVLKYFPGYGELPSQSHSYVLTDTRSLEELETVALLPFAQGIDAGAQAVMMANVIVSAVDEKVPASLSRNVHDLLRKDLDFDGVVISGDLSDHGMSHYGDGGELAVLAVQAGSDLLLTEEYEAGIEAVIRAVNMNHISVERIDESVLRILKMKIANGMME